MTPDERVNEEAWTRRAAEAEAACGDSIPTAGQMPFPGGREFPVPDTTGMTPAERKATLDRWRAEVTTYLRGVQGANPPVSAATAPPPDPSKVSAS